MMPAVAEFFRVSGDPKAMTHSPALNGDVESLAGERAKPGWIWSKAGQSKVEMPMMHLSGTNLNESEIRHPIESGDTALKRSRPK